MKAIFLTAAGIFAALYFIARAENPRAKVHAYGIGSRWKADFENVRSQDLPRVIKAVALYCTPPLEDAPENE